MRTQWVDTALSSEVLSGTLSREIVVVMLVDSSCSSIFYFYFIVFWYVTDVGCLFCRFGEGAGAAKCSEVFVFFCSCVVFVCLFCWFVCLCPHHHKQISEASNRKYTYRTAETELQQRGIYFLFATIWY